MSFDGDSFVLLVGENNMAGEGSARMSQGNQ